MILDELGWRGLIAQSTDLDALAAEALRGPMTVYAGFDRCGQRVEAVSAGSLPSPNVLDLAMHRSKVTDWPHRTKVRSVCLPPQRAVEAGTQTIRGIARSSGE